MKHVLLALVVVAGFAREAQAQSEVQDSVEDQIEAVISQQMAAFRGDDFAQAFGFAADNIKRLFQTPETFGEMVQRGYPMVHRSQDVRFGDLRREGNAVWQRVLVRDARGALYVLDYLMLPTAQGWRIAAVQLLDGAENA
ncbi:MAG: DUF4864 domain-containing protein [Shimia sp.]|jgi:hypothetical protein|uniref:DUF4864 domain-containing protein n=1 Tax=Shimia sp. TaxID=1954381 RepID=UPI004057FAF4